MPVTLPDIVLDTTTVEIRGVEVPVRGFNLLEVGKLIATSPAFRIALQGQPTALLGETELLRHALATCADLASESVDKLRSAEQSALLKEIIRMTVEDVTGPLAELGLAVGTAWAEADVIAQQIAERIKGASSEKSSPPSAG